MRFTFATCRNICICGERISKFSQIYMDDRCWRVSQWASFSHENYLRGKRFSGGWEKHKFFVNHFHRLIARNGMKSGTLCFISAYLAGENRMLLFLEIDPVSCLWDGKKITCKFPFKFDSEMNQREQIHFRSFPRFPPFFYYYAETWRTMFSECRVFFVRCEKLSVR